MGSLGHRITKPCLDSLCILGHSHAAKSVILSPQMGAHSCQQLILSSLGILRPTKDPLSIHSADIVHLGRLFHVERVVMSVSQKDQKGSLLDFSSSATLNPSTATKHL